jgi:hypothetical protein
MLERYNVRVQQCALRRETGEIFTLPRPNRHFHLIKAVVELGWELPIQQDQQGFLLEDGRWVRRKAALIFALTSGQVKEEDLISKNTLLSEDLW